MTSSFLLPGEPCHAQTPRCGFIWISPHGRVTQITPSHVSLSLPHLPPIDPPINQPRPWPLIIRVAFLPGYVIFVYSTWPRAPDDCKASTAKRLLRFNSPKSNRVMASVMGFVCFWVCCAEGQQRLSCTPWVSAGCLIWECRLLSGHKWELCDCVLT